MRALHTIHTLTIRMMLVVTFLLLATAAVSAQTVTVGCAGAAGTFNYTSLGAALAALQPNEAQYQEVIVSGTCTEAVEIGAFADLAITGTPGATITNPGNLAIGSAAKILELRNLTIGPAGLGLFVRTGSVTLTNCIIHEAGVGLEVRPQSQADLNSTTIEDNDRGIELTGPGGFLFIEFSNAIRHNRIGIASEGGSIWIAGAGAEITNNVYGIRLRNRSSLKMNSPALFENNNFGIALTDSSAQLDGSYGGGQTFQANGVAGDSNTAAIIAEGNSHVDLFGAQVSNNHSHGVVLRDNSSLRTANDTITGNAGSGIRLLSLSTAHIYGGMKISGNSGGDLACSLNSFATGYKSGIAKMACLTFTLSTEPPLY